MVKVVKKVTCTTPVDTNINKIIINFFVQFVTTKYIVTVNYQGQYVYIIHGP